MHHQVVKCLKSKFRQKRKTSEAFFRRIEFETDTEVNTTPDKFEQHLELLFLNFQWLGFLAAPDIWYNIVTWEEHDTKCCWLCVKASRNFKPTLCEILHNNSSLRILHLCCRSKWIYLSMTGSHYSCFITSDSTRVVFEAAAETHLYLSKSFYLSIKPAHISLNSVWPTA